MRNLTVSLQDPVARWLRVKAAHEEKSVSRYVSELVTRQMQDDERYTQAMGRFLSRQPRPLHEGGPYPSRDELHERTDLR